MNNRFTVLSYVLATMAGVCFVGGVAILTGGRVEKHGQTGDNRLHARRFV